MIYGHTVNQTARKFSKYLNERLTPLGLFSSQWGVILCLHDRGPCSQTELCEYLSVEAPTMTRTLMRLEKIGYVERRRAVDRRAYHVSLTPHAEEMMGTWTQASQMTERAALKGIDETDLEVFNKVLDQMNRNLDQHFSKFPNEN